MGRVEENKIMTDNIDYVYPTNGSMKMSILRILCDISKSLAVIADKMERGEQ